MTYIRDLTVVLLFHVIWYSLNSCFLVDWSTDSWNSWANSRARFRCWCSLSGPNDGYITWLASGTWPWLWPWPGGGGGWPWPWPGGGGWLWPWPSGGGGGGWPWPWEMSEGCWEGCELGRLDAATAAWRSWSWLNEMRGAGSGPLDGTGSRLGPSISWCFRLIPVGLAWWSGEIK